MKKEDVLNLMDAIGPDLVEEADVQAPARRRMPKIARTALIAACVCLALLGTAFAAANPEAVADFIACFTPVHIQSASLDSGAEGYHIGFEPIRYPVDRFSPAILAAGENRESDHLRFEFDTWEEAHAFIGGDIPCVMPDFVTDRGEPFQVYPSYDNQGRLDEVDVYTDGVLPSVWLNIYTEYSYLDAAGMSGQGLFIESATQSEVLAPYQMANGCQAQIARITYSPSSEEPDVTGAFCFGTFVRDGVLYTVTSSAGRASDEHLLSLLYWALDRFQ